MLVTLEAALQSAYDTYVVWLDRQPLASRSREAYRAQVREYLRWLSDTDDPEAALTQQDRRDWAVRDYKRQMKQQKRWSATTVNQALAAIDNFYHSRSMGRLDVAREQLPQVAPRALDETEQRKLLRAVERLPSVRDRAIVTIMLYTGLRLSELAALVVTDVAITARKGMVTVRSGKGDRYRKVPLNSACRSVLVDWLDVRADLCDLKEIATDALWLSRLGTGLSVRAVGHVIERVADDADLEGLSGHVLRHTFVTNLVRSGADIVLIAELAGHRRLDTTRRYSLPSETDRADAVESVLVEQ